MKKVFTTIAVCLLLSGCGKDNDEGGSPGTQKNAGTFTGTVSGNEYKVDVTCSYLDKDYFRFLSDKNDVTDSNGDGLVISGMEHNGKFVLTITDSGKTFSAGNLSRFTKGDNGAEGSGVLFEEGTAASHEVNFAVVCG